MFNYDYDFYPKNSSWLAFQEAHITIYMVSTGNKVEEIHNKVEEKTKIYVPYNILPLDPDSSNQAIMRFHEVY